MADDSVFDDKSEALLRTCPVCGARPGIMCEEPAAPGDGSGWHSARLRAEAPAIVYRTERRKPLAELRPSDVPHGVDPDDVATDMAPQHDFVGANRYVDGTYIIALSEYELVNLRELIRCCGFPHDGRPAPFPYNTGDWLGQVHHKLSAHRTTMDPNVTLEQVRDRPA